MSDEWRVEVDLEDLDGVQDLLATGDLDDEARDRLGGRVIVTRDGERIFLYADSEETTREAERVMREIVRSEGVDAEIRVTRWHPVEEAWKDAAIPLPQTPEEIEAERIRNEEAEEAEMRAEGEPDWEVRVELPHHRETVELAKTLESEGVDVTRRWRYLLAGTATEEQAQALAERIRSDAPAGTEIRIEPNMSDVQQPWYVLVGRGIWG
jgi:hypothetical protein